MQKIQANSIWQQVKLKGESRVNEKEVKYIKKIISATKANNKIYKPSTYKKVMFDLIHFRQWKETINKEI